jgi:hypothetical protein
MNRSVLRDPLPGIGDEKTIVQLLLRAPNLNQSVSGKLALAEALHNLALLLGKAKDFELTLPQVLELGDLVVAPSNSADACTVAGQLKLHFPGGHARAKFLLQLAQGVCPVQLRLIPLLLRLNHLTGDDLKALALAPLKTLATTEHGL